MDQNAYDKISILYEDDDVMVLDKPAGTTVNTSDTTAHELTLQDWTERHLHIENNAATAVKNEDYTSDEYFQQTYLSRGGIVHRLDKETSGAIIVAKNWQSFRELQREFKERIVKKKYLALVHGKVQPESGEINVPVDRLPWNRKQFGVVAGGREAKTLYQTLAHYQYRKEKEILSLVELEPYTGRTHQIRVHMKYLNHPIFADFLYGGRKISLRDRKVLNRVFLHAATIIFEQPMTHVSLTVESPLPVELLTFLSEQTNKLD